MSWRFSRKNRVSLSTILPLFFLTACDRHDFTIEAVQKLLFPKPQAAPSPGPSPSPSESASSQVRDARAHAEILREMFLVVFMKEPHNRSEFGNWTDTLNQGASLEGVYNGLTHSSDYRKLEMINQGATPDALMIFGEELAYLELELPTPTTFDPTSSSPLPILAPPTGMEEEQEKSDGPPNPYAYRPSPKPSIGWRTLADQYSKQFVGASIFTLKRVIGDEALKLIDFKDDYREKLAFWYSQWVVRLAQRNVDFGLDLRNKANEEFHYKWALANSPDRLRWEALNRLHRLLNNANRDRH